MIKTIFTFLMLISACFTKAQTVEELRDSMAAGNLNMQVLLGIRYLDGDGVAEDSKEGLRLIQDAADKGNRFGELWLGICYQEGIGVDTSKKKAFQYFFSSAQKGNVAAMCRVGQAYEFGSGVEQDIKEAFKYYQKSANGSYPPAMVNLAVCYEHGRGVERDMGKSFEMMKKAADDGDDGALFLLAKYHFNGWGTKKDKGEALRIMKLLKDSSFGEEANRYAAIIEKGDTMRTYEFQFRYIPSILWAYQNGDMEYNDLLDITDWEINLRSYFISHFEWDWKAVTTTIHETDSTTIILYHMPEPEQAPLCLYTAAVINKSNRICRYFTLEKTLNLYNKKEASWIVGGMDGESTHLNFGFLKGEPTEDNFLKQISELNMGDTKASTKLRAK